MKLSGDYETDRESLKEACGYGKCFDLRERKLILGERDATLLYPASMTSS